MWCVVLCVVGCVLVCEYLGCVFGMCCGVGEGMCVCGFFGGDVGWFECCCE